MVAVLSGTPVQSDNFYLEDDLIDAILTNERNAKAIVIKVITNIKEFSAMFKMALVYKLAMEISNSLTGASKALIQNATLRYENYMVDVAVSKSKETTEFNDANPLFWERISG